MPSVDHMELEDNIRMASLTPNSIHKIIIKTAIVPVSAIIFELRSFRNDNFKMLGIILLLMAVNYEPGQNVIDDHYEEQCSWSTRSFSLVG